MSKNLLLKGFFLLVVVAAYPFINVAQEPTKEPDNRECQAPVFSSRQVDRKVKVLVKPEAKFTRDELEKYKHRVIILRTIFCRSGKVTDIKIQHGVTDGLNEKAIEAARLVQFIPAEKDGAKVSVVLILEYHIGGVDQ